MRRFVALALGAVLAGSVLPVLAGGIGSPAQASPGQGLGWTYSESANGYYRPPADTTGGGGGGGGDGIPLERTDYGTPGEWLNCPENDETYACEGDPGAEITGILCGGDGTGPRGLPEYPWIYYQRTIGDDGEPTRWVGKEADCSEPDDDNFVPMEEISYTVNYEVFEPLGDPEIRIHPANNKTLVGLPTVVSTDHPNGLPNCPSGDACLVSMDEASAEVRIPIDIERPGENLQGEIEATASFLWDFNGEGSATGRGRQYEQGVNPIDNPGYYTAGEFQTRGEKTISVTATWEGTVTVELLAPEEIVPIDITNEDTVTVVNSKALLRQ